MKCSYCDSVIPKMPEDGHCPNCGAVLADVQPQQGNPLFQSIQLPKPPIGKYGWNGQYFMVDESSITIHQEFATLRSKTILLSELYDVAFEPVRFPFAGHLTVRSQQDMLKKLPRNNSTDGANEADTFLISFDMVDKMRKVYEYLRQCICLLRGARQPSREEEKTGIYGKHTGMYGHIELWGNCVHFYNRFFGTTRTIFFDQLAEVTLRKADSSHYGVLAVRPNNQDKELNKIVVNAKKDDTSIAFGVELNEQMEKIYIFLSEQKEKTNMA